MESVSEISKQSEIASGEESSHIYKVSIQIADISWAVQLKDTKVSVWFGNPGILDSVRVRNRDLYVPNLDLADVICNMFYLSLPSKLFDTVKASSPQVFMYKEGTRSMIMKADILIGEGVLQEPWDQYFHTMTQFIGKGDKVLGMLDIFVKCNDMGVPTTTEVTTLLKSVIEYEQTVAVPMSKNKIISQIRRKVPHLEQATKSGSGTMFTKDNKTKEETDNRQTQKLISIEGVTEQSMELQRFNKEDRPPQHYLISSDDYDESEDTKTKIQTEAKQITNILKPSFVIVKPHCQGCSKEVEMHYDQEIYKNIDLVVSCNDCNNKQQKQSKDSTEDNAPLIDYVKNLENEYTKYKANSVRKEQYDSLATAQRNLTKFILHTKDEKSHLRDKYEELSTNLEQLAKSEQLLVKQPGPSTTSQKKDLCSFCQFHHETDTPPVKAINVRQSRPFFKFYKTRFTSSSKHEPKLDLPSSSGALEGMCIHNLTDKKEEVYSKLVECMKQREELLAANAALNFHLVSNKTDMINKLSIEWTELQKAWLRKLDQ